MIYYKRKNLWKRLAAKFSEVKLPSLPVFGFLKLLFAILFLTIIILYSSYLYFLPKYFTDEKIEGYLNKYLKDNSKLSLDVENLKINPDYKFDIKLSADRISLLLSNNRKFITLDKPDIEVDLLTLFFHYIDLNKIKAKKITINTNFTKNNRYDCFDYFDLDILEFKNSEFNLRNIKIICDELIFNLFDENIKKNFQLRTKKLIFSSSDIEKPFLIQTQGEITGAQKIADFKINLELKSQKDFIKKLKSQIQNLNYNPLVHALKFKFYTNSDIDLKIKNNAILGYINLSDFNFVIDNIQIPKNNLHLIFKDNKIKAQGDFNFIKNQFIKLVLNANYSKNKFVELKLNSSEINLFDLKKIASALCKIFNLKYNFDSIYLEGVTSADVYLKSDFKTVTSKGFASIKDAKLKDSVSGLVLNEINSNISFDNNKVNIQEASATVGVSKFYLGGTVDNFANLNLKINSEPVNIAQIISTIKNLPLLSHIIPELNDYIFKSGFVKVNAAVNGTLNNPVIKTNSEINNFKLFIKSLNCLIQSENILITANPENNVLKDIFITAKNNIITQNGYQIYNNIAKLKVIEDDIVIDKTQVKYENIKADIKGVVKNYKKDSVLELNINSILPINNNLIIIKNKKPQFLADILIDKNKLTIKQAKINDAAKAQQIALLSGNIYEYQTKNPSFENLKISLLDKISCILPKIDNLNFEATGDILISGKLNNPIITGGVKLYNVICKKYNLFIQNCDLHILNSYLDGNIATLDVLETTLNNVIFKGNLDGDVLKVSNFSADAFQGKISGSANINVKNLNVDTELLLKEISIRHLSSYLKQYSIAASGRLSALSRFNFTGLDYQSAINSIQGYIKFNIDNGELAQFAKLERFLQAGNILSQSILKLTLNSIVSSVTKQNTGDFKTIEGTVKINSPMAEVQYINTQGTNMAMHIEGKYNIISNHAFLRVLGRIPLNIVSVMGNIGKFSLSQLLNSQPSESAIEKMMSDYMSENDRAKIPSLVNYQQNAQTREFIVIIDGLLNNNSSIKYFKWGYKNKN